MKLVLVEWIDPCSFATGWTERGNFEEATPVKCITVGIALRETKKEIIVSLNLNERNYSNAMVIPKENIRRIRKLRI